MRPAVPWQRATAGLITTGVIAASVFGLAGTASAAATSPVTELTYIQNGNLYLANPDGSNPQVLVSGGVSGTVSWFADGSQFAYIQNGNLFLSTANGRQVRQLTTDGQASEPVASTFYAPRILFRDAGSYYMASEDPGMGVWSYPLDGTDAATSANDTTVYVNTSGDLSVEYATYSPTDIQATQPAISADGTEVAYVDPTTSQIVIRSLGEAPTCCSLVFGSPTTVTADTGADSHPQFSADGKSLLYENGGNVLTVSASASATAGTLLVSGASAPTETTLQPKHVVREWGSNAVETAIAVSQRNFGPITDLTDPRLRANGVVLSRSDTFYDALVGSAFAGARGMPLLLTKPTSLDPNDLAEIQRVLPRGGRVYLLGGTAALSSSIETELNNDGFRTTRFAGKNMFDTAVQVEQSIAQTSGNAPSTVFVATGSSYYDALAAGPIASSRSAVVVLSKGSNSNPSLPAESAAYLNSMTPFDPATGEGTRLVGVGGPGYKAITQALASGQLSNWPKTTQVTEVVGSNAEETALDLARFEQPNLSRIGIATVSDWHDALAGGASLGGNTGVLLLTPSTGLYANDADFIAKNSPEIGEVDVFGGTAALSPQVVTDAMPLIGSSLVVDSLEVTPGNVPPVLIHAVPQPTAARPNTRQRAASRLR